MKFPTPTSASTATTTSTAAATASNDDSFDPFAPPPHLTLDLAPVENLFGDSTSDSSDLHPHHHHHHHHVQPHHHHHHAQHSVAFAFE